MIRYCIMWLILATFYACSPGLNQGKSVEPFNQLSQDRNGKPMLIGRCKVAALSKAPFGEWFTKNYEEYAVNKAAADSLQPLLRDKRFVLFLGTWCGDSKREVPRMLRLLDYCGVKPGRVQLIMVSNHDSVIKQSPTREERGLHIHRVPTLLVYDGDTELGRIVEEPVKTIEQDLLAIVNGQSYGTAYKIADALIAAMATTALPDLLRDTVALANRLRPMATSWYELNTFAEVSLRAGETDKALLLAVVNTLLFPKEADVQYRLGYIHQARGEKAAAMDRYQWALRLNGAHEQATQMLKALQ
jgi:hypothetical protein